MKDIVVRFGLVWSYGSNSRQDRELTPRSVIVAFLESVSQGVNWSQHKHGCVSLCHDCVCLCFMAVCVCVCLRVMNVCVCVMAVCFCVYFWSRRCRVYVSVLLFAFGLGSLVLYVIYLL
jgi:hypothetical protein